MPKQNRVTPFSEIVSTPARGTLMGNRGCLHNSQQQLIRPYKGKRWIICLLDFRGRQRQVMTPNRYTELFFLDEATALAAGHRPCAECQRKRYQHFRDVWLSANANRVGDQRFTVDAMDAALHADRLTPNSTQRTYEANLIDLPTGTFVQLPGDKRAFLWWGARLLPWSVDGYGAPVASPTAPVTVLTPRSTVNALAAGFVPSVHRTANSSKRV